VEGTHFRKRGSSYVRPPPEGIPPAWAGVPFKIWFGAMCDLRKRAWVTPWRRVSPHRLGALAGHFGHLFRNQWCC
jgi:hypothetical protein